MRESGSWLSPCIPSPSPHAIVFTFKVLDPEDHLALRGQSILSKSISVTQLLHEQLLREVAYGPLPDEDRLDKEDHALSPVRAPPHQNGIAQTVSSPALAIPPLDRKRGDGLGPTQCDASVEGSGSFFSTVAGPSACSDAHLQGSTVMPPSQKKAKDKLRSAKRKKLKRQALRAAGVTHQTEQLLKKALYGLLTDLESTDDDSEPTVHHNSPPCHQSPAVLTDGDSEPADKVHHDPPCGQPPGWRAKDRIHTADRRKRKRALQAGTDASSNGIIKGVAKKRRAAAARDIITVDYCLSKAARVSQPGWIGKRVSGLPCREFSLQELVDDYGMTCFRWDGR